MATTDTEDGPLRIGLIVLAIILLSPMLMMVFAMPMMGMMGWWGGGMFGGRFSPLWGIGMLLVWLVIIVGIGYFFYRGLVGRGTTGHTGDPALEELRTAYARGELSEEEYVERHERLQMRE
ncbi:SHOCT domain-containing protein [Haladaptatus sp. DFWS20]|uniref:SHOCT domain-containing protein n=1 Tax=Haladaptatus sp. DFWS20 TaxID=3403467 RepID=UPI003EBD0ED2